MKFITESYVKQYLKEAGKQTSASVFDELNKFVEKVLYRSIKLSEGDTAKTVMGRHIERSIEITTKSNLPRHSDN